MEKDGGGTMVNPGGGGPHGWGGVIVNTVGMGAFGTNAGGMNTGEQTLAKQMPVE